MMNTDFFKVRNFSNKPSSSRPGSKEATPKRSQIVYARDKKGIQSLLEGSSKSHCNTFVGYSRIPHKYDHFHEKTIPSSTVGSFLQGWSPRRSDPEKNLLSLSEQLDINQARTFFRKQLVFQEVFDVNKFPSIPKRLKKHK
jgi:hypothetical protein